MLFRSNALGFCVGGTLLAVALAVAAARGEDGVESATFLASMLDFSDTGEIGLFIDEPTVALREATIGRGGVMPGRDLALVFSALRANDLVWSYVVSSYLDELHRAGALAGAKPSQGYFVRCGHDTMTTNDLDAGRLVAEVGIAPLQPLEYIVLRLTVASEVLVQLEAGRG